MCSKMTIHEGDLNPRCTQGRENVGQSNYMPITMCASPATVSSTGQVRVILTRLEPLVLPGTTKKSRILWNEEKEKRLMELYERSTVTRRGDVHGDFLRHGP